MQVWGQSHKRTRSSFLLDPANDTPQAFRKPGKAGRGGWAYYVPYLELVGAHAEGADAKVPHEPWGKQCSRRGRGQVCAHSRWLAGMLEPPWMAQHRFCRVQ